jgi:hypothetical protein
MGPGIVEVTPSSGVTPIEANDNDLPDQEKQ